MRPPDITGRYGKGWITPTDDTPKCPRGWLLDCPGQSPLWSHYLAVVIDLSGLSADGSEASLDFPDARWEYAVWALADDETKPDPDDPTTFQYLRPQNVRVQVPDHPSGNVTAVLDAMVEAAVAGMLAVEPMFQRDLDPIWREHIEATLEHPHHHHV